MDEAIELGEPNFMDAPEMIGPVPYVSKQTIHVIQVAKNLFRVTEMMEPEAYDILSVLADELALSGTALPGMR